MPSLAEMEIYAKANPKIVWTYQQVIVKAYNDCPAVKAGVDSTISVMHGPVRSFAILIAMGYGTQAARDTILPLYIANRLEQ
jgi:hypothetical protein